MKSIVKSLISHGADPNLEHNGMSALAVARDLGMRTMVKWMTRPARRV